VAERRSPKSFCKFPGGFYESGRPFRSQEFATSREPPPLPKAAQMPKIGPENPCLLRWRDKTLLVISRFDVCLVSRLNLIRSPLARPPGGVFLPFKHFPCSMPHHVPLVKENSFSQDALKLAFILKSSPGISPPLDKPFKGFFPLRRLSTESGAFPFHLPFFRAPPFLSRL